MIHNISRVAPYYVYWNLFQPRNAMKNPSLPTRISILVLVVLSFVSCEKESPDPVSKDHLSGFIQKGPFLNGTSVQVSELTADLGQTGKNFSTQTSDNTGTFELGKIDLVSPYVELKADGFYFNEISNEPSSARLVLYALSDLEDKNTINVNMMSHLEKDRIYHLTGEHMSFPEAKQQAQEEVLRIFSIEKPDIAESELLDISQQGDDHAILLAISVILQGYRSVAELSGLLADINSDFKEDGELNDPSIGSALMNHAVVLDLPGIRKNLEDRYAETGNPVTLPDFEKYVEWFKENSTYFVTEGIEYPQFSEYGENILYPGKTQVTAGIIYSVAANLSAGTSLTVRLSGGGWSYCVMPDGPVNWDVSEYSFDTRSQTFSSIASGESCDLKIIFDLETINPPDTVDIQPSGNSVLIEAFENRSDTVTWSKSLGVNLP
jgi:hypothetical protein